MFALTAVRIAVKANISNLWLSAAAYYGGAQDAFRCHGAEQAFQRDLDVLAPGQGGPQFHSQPWVPVVWPDGLEPDGEQVVDGQHARRLGPLLVAERLDGPDATPGQVFGHSLDEHPPKTAAGELAEHPRRHQQHRVRAYRAGGKCDRPRHI